MLGKASSSARSRLGYKMVPKDDTEVDALPSEDEVRAYDDGDGETIDARPSKWHAVRRDRYVPGVLQLIIWD
jgi:hypothetical protein